MNDRYRLIGKEVVPGGDLLEWARWFETAARQVVQNDVAGSTISTVFLGLDHQFGSGPPLLFETMVFGGPLDGEQARCSTYAEAEAQHAAMVESVREKLQ